MDAYLSTSASAPRTDPFSAVGELLETLVRNGLVAGVSALVCVNGEERFRGCRGFADISSAEPIGEDTIFRIFSMTKPVTAAAIMVLVDEGRLTLEDAVEAYLPEFGELQVLLDGQGDEGLTERAGPMRVIDLLRNSSGMSNSWPLGVLGPAHTRAGLASLDYLHDARIGGLPGLARRIATLPLQFQPGTRWYYSMAPDIAGLIVERVTGGSFGQFLHDRIFRPLGMNDTAFSVPPAKASRLASMYARPEGVLTLMEDRSRSPFLGEARVQSGAAGLLSTLTDYSRFAAMLARGGSFAGQRILSEQSARMMMSSALDATFLEDSLEIFMPFGAGISGAGMGAALGGAVLLDPELADTPGTKGEYAWGGAASSTFFVAPALGVSAVLMTQLFPAGGIPLLGMLKTAVYQSLGANPGVVT